MLFLFFLFILFSNSFSKKDINLTKDNNLVLRGTINEDTASNIIYEINKSKIKNNFYLIIDSNGGEVQYGMQIINEIVKTNISCIAIKAYSMGFAILQSCKRRYVLPHTNVMQHQMSAGIRGEFGKMTSYIHLLNQYEAYLLELQTDRIGIHKKLFKQKTDNEWWLFGFNIVYENVADDIVNIVCSKELTSSNYTITNGFYDYTYSSCPLITKELKVKKNKKNNDFSFFFI